LILASYSLNGSHVQGRLDPTSSRGHHSCLPFCDQNPALTTPQPLQPAKNFAKAAEFIGSAAQKGARLAVLPEYHLTNWLPEDPQFAPLCAQWESYLEKYQGLARKHSICIVPGTIVQTYKDKEAGEDQLHNVAYFIDDNGEILGRYQKKNLWCCPDYPASIVAYTR